MTNRSVMSQSGKVLHRSQLQMGASTVVRM